MNVWKRVLRFLSSYDLRIASTEIFSFRSLCVAWDGHLDCPPFRSFNYVTLSALVRGFLRVFCLLQTGQPCERNAATQFVWMQVNVSASLPKTNFFSRCYRDCWPARQFLRIWIQRNNVPGSTYTGHFPQISFVFAGKAFTFSNPEGSCPVGESSYLSNENLFFWHLTQVSLKQD